KLNTGTIVIGATNRESDLDKALKRRFSIKHEMKLPTKEIRQKIIEKYFDSIPDASYTDRDMQAVLKITENYSCARLTNLIVNRIVKCLSEDKPITLA
ncbi:ATP-binding protein, partial [Clostridium sp.]|uniref:ATP-binding protein n=1 Tax=Clostridium sp. TaxID=1506 RepID=UPI00258F94A6